MNLFLDCEWDGDRLISIGLVDENANWFYRWMNVRDVSDWVQKNVMLRVEAGAGSWSTFTDVQHGLQHYLNVYDEIHVIADWPEDIAWFCKLLITGPGKRLDTPPLTMEIDRMLDSDNSEIPNHALHDAFAIRKKWLEMRK